MRVIESFNAMKALVGEEIGVSSWVDVTQERIDKFAAATGDHQWIHVDRERAARELPGGKTIAHGFLTLSLLPQMIYDIYRIDGVAHGLNYGTNRVRFTAPVPAGSRVRARLRVKQAEDAKDGGLRMIGEATIELEGSDRPACVAETISLVYPRAV